MLEEDQPQDDVLVFRRVHAAAKGIGHPPQLVFVAVEIGCRVVGTTRMDPTICLRGLDGGRWRSSPRGNGNRAAASTTGRDCAIVDQRLLDPLIRAFIPAEGLAQLAIARRTAKPGQRGQEFIFSRLFDHRSFPSLLPRLVG